MLEKFIVIISREQKKNTNKKDKNRFFINKKKSIKFFKNSAFIYTNKTKN